MVQLFKINGRKGFYFLIDVLIGLSIIIIGSFLLLTYYAKIPITIQPSFYADDILLTLSSGTYEEITTSYGRELIEKGVLGEKEPFGSYLADLCQSGRDDLFQYFMEGIIATTIPEHLGYSISLLEINETSCLFFSNDQEFRLNQSPMTSFSRNIVLGINDSYSIVGPYIMEVAVW